MELLVLVFLFAALGYFLALSSIGGRVDRATSKVTTETRDLADRVETSWKALFSRQDQGQALRAWANGSGSDLLPADFKLWLASLSDEDALAFSKALGDYAHTLDFDLNTLIEGGLDHQPIMRQVFVEAIVVYTPAYRKARQARQQAEEEDKAKKSAPPANGKEKAEKRSGSKKAEKPVEVGEPAATD